MPQQIFTHDDTWTVPANVLTVQARLYGWGGNGGTAHSGDHAGAGGGGGGAYLEAVMPVTAGDVWTVTVENASGSNSTQFINSGTSQTLIANGGSAGGDTSPMVNGTGGAGGTYSSSGPNIGLLAQVNGQDGQNGGSPAGIGGKGGTGGAGIAGGLGGNESPGNDGVAIGDGAGGGGENGSAAGNKVGGVGQPGKLILAWLPHCIKVCCQGCENSACIGNAHYGPHGMAWPDTLYAQINYGFGPGGDFPPDPPCNFGISDGQVVTLKWNNLAAASITTLDNAWYSDPLSDGGCDPDTDCGGQCGPVVLAVKCSVEATGHPLVFAYYGPSGRSHSNDALTISSCWPLLATGISSLDLAGSTLNQLAYTQWTVYQ
jgi:hypothetical protein